MLRNINLMQFIRHIKMHQLQYTYRFFYKIKKIISLIKFTNYESLLNNKFEKTNTIIKMKVGIKLLQYQRRYQ